MHRIQIKTNEEIGKKQKSKAFMLPFPSLFHRQIINRHGMALTITNDGTVKGLPEDSSANKNAILEFSPTEPPGKKRHLSSFIVLLV